MLLRFAFLIFLQNPVQSLPLPIADRPNGYTITGGLKFETDVKPVSMDVTLEVDDGQVVQRTMSGPNGDFRFERLRYGRYFVVVEGERFWSVREPVTIDQGAFDDVRIILSLKSRPGMGAAPGADIVSIEALKLPPPPREAQREYDRALEEQQKGQGKKAVEHLQRALKIFPDYYDANLQLGIEQHRAGKVEEAIRSLGKAVALHPMSVSGRRALAKIHFERLQFQESVDDLSPLVKSGVADAEIYTLLGAAFYKLNDLQRAEEHLHHAVALLPETAGPAHLQLYNVYMKSNRLPLALEQLEAYLTKNPDAPDRNGMERQAARLRQIIKK